MGMFDNQCMITGVKLDNVACVLLVERPDGSHSPCTLPLFGYRDPHGGVIDIEEHSAVDSLTAGVAAAVRLGDITLATPSWVSRFDVSPDRAGLQRFIDLFFRGGHAQHAEGRITLTLIERHVWNAISSAVGGPLPAVDMSSVLYPAPLASTLYADAPRATVELASRFRAMQIWLAARDIAWAPLRRAEQFDESDVAELVTAAAERFSSEPTIMNGLLDYAHWEIDESLTQQQLLDGL